MYEYSSVFLEHEDWPEWFTLDFHPGSGRKSPPRLLIGFAREPLQRLITKLPKCILINTFKKSLQEEGVEADFLLDTDKPWGFCGVLEPYRRANRDDRHKFIEYSILIPQVEKDAGKCKDCGGTLEVDGMNCFHCDGTGRETVREYGSLDRIAATLHVLGFILDKPDKELLAGINIEQKQLLSVRTFFGSGHAHIGAVLSRQFGDYVRSLSEQELPEVKAAIKRAYLWMFPRYKKFGDFHFRANVQRNGQLIIDVPGSACGLYVDGFSRSLKEVSGPMELDCHNVDGHHQQLTLLSGLATLCGAVRKNLYPNA